MDVCLLEQRFGASQGERSNSEPSQGLAQHSHVLGFFGLNILSLQILFVVKGHIVGVCCFGIRWGVCFPLWWRLTPLWPLNTDFQPCLSAASWHSAALPTSPPSPFRAAESTLAVCEWGNICSRSLQHREGAVCRGVTLVQRAEAPPMWPFTARVPKRGRCWLHSQQELDPCRGAKPHRLGSPRLNSHGIALHRGGRPRTPDTGMGVTAVPPSPALCTSPAADSLTNTNPFSNIYLA